MVIPWLSIPGYQIEGGAIKLNVVNKAGIYEGGKNTISALKRYFSDEVDKLSSFMRVVLNTKLAFEC